MTGPQELLLRWHAIAKQSLRLSGACSCCRPQTVFSLGEIGSDVFEYVASSREATSDARVDELLRDISESFSPNRRLEALLKALSDPGNLVVPESEVSKICDLINVSIESLAERLGGSSRFTFHSTRSARST